MKRSFRWLETKISRPKNPNVADQPSDPMSVKPDDIANDDNGIETSFDAEVPPDSQEPGRNVLMPDIYADEHVDTEPDLEILDQSSPDVDKSSGFNPYDTAVLKKKPGSESRRTQVLGLCSR